MPTPPRNDELEKQWRDQVAKDLARVEKQVTDGLKEVKDQIVRESEQRITGQAGIASRVGDIEKQLSQQVGEIKGEIQSFKTEVAHSFGAVNTQMAEMVGTINTNLAKESGETKTAVAELSVKLGRYGIIFMVLGALATIAGAVVAFWKR